MKKALVILFALIGFSAFSQNLLVNSFDGGCEFIKTSTNDTAYYSNNTAGFAYVKGNGMTYLFTKVGGQIGSAYLFSDISVNDSVYATRETFLNAINAIPFFSSVAANGIDSGEVIGNFLYLFSSDDTTIIDVSGISVSGDSLWSISTGKYEQIYNIPFNQGFQGYKLLNDSINLGPLKLPYVGVMGPDLGSYKSAVAYVDATGAGSTRIHSMGYTDFLGAKYNSIAVNDTSAIYIRSRGDIFNEAVGRFTVTASERLLVNTDTATLNADSLLTLLSKSVTISSTKDININADTNLNGAVGSAVNRGDVVYTFGSTPYDSLPSMVHELQNYKNYATGFAALHAPDKKYANIYYGTLDSVTNLITDITRVETTKEHVQMKWHEDYVHLDSLGFRADIPSQNNSSFKIDSNGLNTPSFSTDPTGDEGAIYYNTTDSIFKGYEKGQWMPLISRTGFISYIDTTYNSTTPYTLPADSVEKFPFRWTSKVDGYLPYGIDSLFSRADSTLIFPQGTAFDMMLYFSAEPSSVSQWVDVWIDIGGSVGELYRQTFVFPKGVGIKRGILYGLPSAYALNTFEANGGTIYIQSNADLEIYRSNLNVDIDYLD